jgi:hypothetical protein
MMMVIKKMVVMKMMVMMVTMTVSHHHPLVWDLHSGDEARVLDIRQSGTRFRSP